MDNMRPSEMEALLAHASDCPRNRPHEGACSCWPERDDRLAAAIRQLIAERDALQPEAFVGVGDGGGNLFVGGSYEATKACQEKLFHMERLAAQLAEAQGQIARLESQLRELAAAAQHYLMAEIHVGVTEDQLRAANQRLGSLAGPHLMAATAPQEPTNG